MDTYANILYKLGKKRTAINWEEMAATLEPRNKEFQSNLEKNEQRRINIINLIVNYLLFTSFHFIAILAVGYWVHGALLVFYLEQINN